MLAHIHPAMIAIAFLLWPLIKSTVFLATLAVYLGARKPSRKAAAGRLLRILCGGPG
jgi:hypothetical protein